MNFLTLSMAVAAAALTLAHAEITVQDDFVDESAIAQLRGQFPAASERFLEFINVPRSLYERMAGLVAPNERKALAAAAATATSVQLPAHRALLSGKKGVAEHKDGYLDASAVEQNVGLLYLKGDGVVRFTHEATGEQTHVDVKPGRFLTWDNMAYTHTVFPGQETREMLGPMTFKDTHAHMSGFCDPGVLQAWADRLLVKPGSLLKIYLEMIFDELPSDCDWKRRHLEETRGLGSSNPTANICLTKTNGVDRRMLNTFKRSTSETTFTKSSVFPNTWKPKVQAETINDGDTLKFELPEDGIVLNKLYKLTWVVKVGTEVASGEELTFNFLSNWGWNEQVTVVVK